MYWEKSFRVPLIADAMRRDRLFLIRSNIKVVFDNEISPDQRKADRIWKLRPFLEQVLQGCLKQYRMQSLSLDKMIVPFTGTCPVKQFVPNKQNPECLTELVLANPDRVVCDFVVYQGKQSFPEDMNEKFWQCECSILIITRSLVPGYVLYIDRFFNRTILADQLIDQGITSTLMKSRVPKNTDLPDDQGFKKNNERGTSAVTIREDGKMVRQ